MRNSIRVAAVIGAVLVSSRVASAQAGGPPQPSVPQVVVSGHGEATVTPDRATIFLGVQTRASTAAAAAAQNARVQSAILDTLRKIGFGNDQLATVNYNVSPDMQYSPDGRTPPKVVGYVVTNQVKAEARRIEDVAKAIDAALAKGANEVASLQFYSSKADSARRAALAAAVADARADAEVLARAAGGTLGNLLEMSTVEMPIRPVPMMAQARMVAAAPTPIEPGQQTISATVTVRWALVVR